MLKSSRERILESLPDNARVLDVGGWGKPFPRADWVIDLQPYETRGLYGYSDDQRAEERFSQDTWLNADICGQDPWELEDDSFDFVICSHTLEDVRDPIRVCQEICRVGKAGYVEVPSRLEEQSYGFQGPWVGWDHHRWFSNVGANEIEFVFKSHYVHGGRGRSFPQSFHEQLSIEERVASLWWEGNFEARERIMWTTGELDAYLVDFVRVNGGGDRYSRARTARRRISNVRRRGRD